MSYAIAGNAPIFVSKLDGHISTYRSGLSIDGMIEEHEEKNKIWILSQTNITTDTSLLLALKRILNWSQRQLNEFCNSNDGIIDKGSKRRLMQIQSNLDSINIMTTLTLDQKDSVSTNR